jgi:hypothetical protein
MRFGLALPSYSFADLDYPEGGAAARLRDRRPSARLQSLWVIRAFVDRAAPGATCCRRSKR